MTLVYRIENDRDVIITSINASIRALDENDFNSVKKISEVTSKFCVNAINKTTALDLSPKFSAINNEHIAFLTEYMIYFKKYEEWANAYSKGEYQKLSNFSNDAANAGNQANIHMDNIDKMLEKCQYRF